MHILENKDLLVSVLDPVRDRERFGTRYCTGGYIFQITDSSAGELLTGPTYPDSFNSFDGQGIPDSFFQVPLRAKTEATPEALILGIGVCDLPRNVVREFCTWKVEATGASLTMRTHHSFQGFEIEIERALTLSGRTLRSRTHVLNRGKNLVPLNWFPHPFFPQPEGDELCAFNLNVSFPENPGYLMGGNGFIRRKDWPWDNGRFQSLSHDGRGPLMVLQRHHRLGLIGARCSYTPSLFPIWGNRNTFSWEPYFERSLSSGTDAEWWIDYDF